MMSLEDFTRHSCSCAALTKDSDLALGKVSESGFQLLQRNVDCLGNVPSGIFSRRSYIDQLDRFMALNQAFEGGDIDAFVHLNKGEPRRLRNDS